MVIESAAEVLSVEEVVIENISPQPESDCLLFLTAVRAKGYLSTSPIDYPTLAVVKALWRRNAADSARL
jgi:hypothetical protein